MKPLEKRLRKFSRRTADRVLAKALKDLGWEFEACKATYDAMGVVSYRAKFILSENLEAVKNRNAVGDWKVGDKAKGSDGTVYTVTGFTDRGKIQIRCEEDGKRYKCRANCLTKVTA